MAMLKWLQLHSTINMLSLGFLLALEANILLTTDPVLLKSCLWQEMTEYLIQDLMYVYIQVVYETEMNRGMNE